jgi:hypothetical protein
LRVTIPKAEAFQWHEPTRYPILHISFQLPKSAKNTASILDRRQSSRSDGVFPSFYGLLPNSARYSPPPRAVGTRSQPHTHTPWRSGLCSRTYSSPLQKPNIAYRPVESTDHVDLTNLPFWASITQTCATGHEHEARGLRHQKPQG